MLLFIDNFDSFTYNLVQYFQIIGTRIEVIRNNAISLEEYKNRHSSFLVIGPGPGTPEKSGISLECISFSAPHIPILGVCLGHQCIAALYGGNIMRAKAPMHGKTSKIIHDGKGIFFNLPQNFIVTRYHSLIVEKKSLPPCLEISAETVDGEIMGLRHRDYLHMESVQFHPEAVQSEHGLQLLQNFLSY
jgi:para-aminobenzoate synthetase component II